MRASYKETPATESYTLSLHDALPIYLLFTLMDPDRAKDDREAAEAEAPDDHDSPWGRHPLVITSLEWLSRGDQDRKSTRLNSSHRCISYAVFCLKKKTVAQPNTTNPD